MQFLLTLFAQQPAIRTTQIGLIVLAVIAVYLVFFVTRDISIRSRSFFYQVICILIAAFIPIVGFFFYILIRPASTIRERDMEDMLLELTGRKSKKTKEGKKAKDAKEE